MVLPLALQRNYCSTCPKMCHFSCPVSMASAMETHSPGWLMTLFKMAEEGEIDWEEVSETFYACSGCFHCHTYCRHQNDLPRAMTQAREEVFQRGFAPAKLAELAKKITRDSLLSKETPLVEETVLLPFCSCFSRGKEEGETIQNLFHSLGIPIKIPEKNLCCGAPLKALGDHQGFLNHCQSLFRILRGVSQVLVTSFECGQILNALGLPSTKISHYLDFLALKLPNFSLSQKPSLPHPLLFCESPLEKGLWQDGLGRKWFFKVFSHLDFLPPPWIDNPCVGVNFGLTETHPQWADKMAETLIQKAIDSGAKGLVVSCVKTGMHLRKRGKLAVFSPAELLLRGLGS